MTKFVSMAAFGFGVFASISFVAGQQQAPAAGACGGQPFCVETSDFTATVTSFRTSLVGSSRIISVSVRFQNRTAQPLVLGYVANSGITTDERGNRYIVYGGNGFRGIGLVYGNTFDHRFTLRPAGSGDTQFEMHLQATPQNAGLNFTVDLTIDEINNSGGQSTLGGEFPLHFEGLANGVSGSGSLAGAPDGLANAVSNLKSIFGKKKAVQNAATVANSTASTAATVNAAANSPTSQSPSASANTLGQAGSSAKATPQQLASAQPAAGTPSGQATGAAEPWTPPTDKADKAAEAAALADPLKLPEVAKMPDVVGVHPGMSLPQVLQILHGQYPRDRFVEIPYDYIPNRKLEYGFNVERTDAVGPDAIEAIVSLTAPPSHQVVWRIVRFGHALHATHANVLAALREKYGKESFAGASNGSPVTDDRYIGTLWWIFDEHGNRAPMPSAAAFGSNDINSCLREGIPDAGPRMPVAEIKDPNWCASFVGVRAQFEASEIIERTTVDLMDLRLANRTANAFAAWQRDAAEKAHAADLEKSKKNKPVF
jgi:hypothetical protein